MYKVGVPFRNPTIALREVLLWMDETFDDVDLPLVFFDAAATIGYEHDRYFFDDLKCALYCPDGRVIETLEPDLLSTASVRVVYPDGTTKDMGEIPFDRGFWVVDETYYPSLYEALRVIAEKARED